MIVSHRMDETQCTLCQESHLHYSSPTHWKNVDACTLAESFKLSSTDLVCYACRKDITRVINDSSYLPRWVKPKHHSKVSTCCIDECSQDVFTSFHKASLQQLQSALQTLELTCNTTEILPAPLCKHHYHLVYNLLQPTQTHCITCGTSLKHSNPKVCPKPTAIQHYLAENTHYDGCIMENDKVCYVCYRAQLVILKQIDGGQTPSTDLASIVNTLAQEVSVTSSARSIQEAIDCAMKQVIVHVGKELLDGNVMLLASAHDLLAQYAVKLLQHEHQKEDITKLVQARWVLSSLTGTLDYHLSYNCTVRRYGTLLYRSDSDIRPALTRALWKLRNNTCKGDSPTCDATEVLEDLNMRVHLQIKHWLKKDAHSPIDHSETNVKKLIEDMDPKLWDAISLLTRSISERRGTSKVLDDTSTPHNIKSIRRLFLLCNLMFITDDRCSVPLHVLMTDIVDSQGGSSLLIKVLNRVGVCASADTLSRFIQFKVTHFDSKVQVFADSESFPMISVDNVDYANRYSRVASGSDSNFSHGTTVQAVHPLPSFSLQPQSGTLNSHFNLDSALADTLCQSNPSLLPSISLGTTIALPLSLHPPSSPDSPSHHIQQSLPHSSSLPNSDPLSHQQCLPISTARPEPSASFPFPLALNEAPKRMRRMRTGTEQQFLGDTAMDSEAMLPTSTLSATTSCQWSSVKGKTISDFKVSPSEVLEQRQFQEELNTYMILKAILSETRPSSSLLSLQRFFSMTRSTHTEKSDILYLEVMDAVADSKDTMITMLHTLHHKFIEGQSRQFLVVEGDAKLYDILQSLKHEYGEELKWVIPYPGDWHTLMNYQTPLMKGGLKQMAKAAGYPINQIKNCSQFKRVHYFILEAWVAVYRCMLLKFFEGMSLDTSLQELISKSLESANSQTQAEFQRKFNIKLADINNRLGNRFTEFYAFVHKMAAQDDTWRYWKQFVLEDAMAYVGFYLAIRSGDWELRVAYLKTMAPFFTAFDHHNYQKLISQHLADILCMPPSVLFAFQQGRSLETSGTLWPLMRRTRC